MHLQRAVVVVGMALASGAGCTLLTSTDGLSGTETVPDGGAADSASDAAATETGPVADAGADSDADAAVGPYCASLSPPPKFCADFDMGVLTDYGSPSNGATFDSAVFKSPSRSLLCTVSGGAVDRYSQLDKAFGESPSSYEVSFDIFVDTYDASRDVELVGVHLSQGGGATCDTKLSIRGSVWHFDESCETASASVFALSHDAKVTAAIGRWVHVDYAVSLVAPRALSLAIDGAKAIDALTPNAALSTGSARLIMGISYLQQNATGSKVHLDNVRFDFK